MRLSTFAAVLALWLVPKEALAHSPVLGTADHFLVVGPSFAYAPGSGRRSGALIGGDLTFTRAIGWGSVGTRVRLAETPTVYPYVEAGLYLIVNVGIGYSQGIGADVPLHNWHWFLGLPLLVDVDEKRMLLIEPYYRPTMAVKGATPTLHELGLLFKWAWEFKPNGGD